MSSISDGCRWGRFLRRRSFANRRMARPGGSGVWTASFSWTNYCIGTTTAQRLRAECGRRSGMWPLCTTTAITLFLVFFFLVVFTAFLLSHICCDSCYWSKLATTNDVLLVIADICVRWHIDTFERRNYQHTNANLQCTNVTMRCDRPPLFCCNGLSENCMDWHSHFTE